MIGVAHVDSMFTCLFSLACLYCFFFSFLFSLLVFIFVIIVGVVTVLSTFVVNIKYVLSERRRTTALVRIRTVLAWSTANKYIRICIEEAHIWSFCEVKAKTLLEIALCKRLLKCKIHAPQWHIQWLIILYFCALIYRYVCKCGLRLPSATKYGITG